ncbi:S-4TM family putative pore-forming effector [Synechococcus sp. BA-120 BA3]|nr:S-4TM family putative pore-forming effector [Synechococcus sp. BA-120 BA3]
MPISAVSSISSRQNEPAQIQLLQAQRHLYGKAKRLVYLQLCLVLAVPVAAASLAYLFPDSPLTAAIAFAAVVVSLVDVTVLDPHQRRTILIAAKVQETFDCAVFQLPWDHLVAGARLERELIHEAATAYKKKRGDAGLRDWYPTESSSVALHFGRLICQRSALAYDSSLRRRYAAVVLTLPLIVLATLILAGIANEATLQSFILSVLLPLLPVAIWTLREHGRQKEAAETNDELRMKIDDLLARMNDGTCDSTRASAEARTVQSELFRGRKIKTPILGWVYQAMRKGLERRMRAVAEELVSSVEFQEAQSEPFGTS